MLRFRFTHFNAASQNFIFSLMHFQLFRRLNGCSSGSSPPCVGDSPRGLMVADQRLERSSAADTKSDVHGETRSSSRHQPCSTAQQRLNTPDWPNARKHPNAPVAFRCCRKCRIQKRRSATSDWLNVDSDTGGLWSFSLFPCVWLDRSRGLFWNPVQDKNFID